MKTLLSFAGLPHPAPSCALRAARFASLCCALLLVFAATAHAQIAPYQWTWMGGSSTVSPNDAKPGVYGMQGTPDPANVPGSRSGAVSWTDTNGNLWLFGGWGFDVNGIQCFLNDLWEYSPANNEWVWMGGSSTDPLTPFGAEAGQPGVYGIQGTPAPANVPGSRSGGSVGWTDKSGNLWLFGGYGFDVNGNFGVLNDLWEYSQTSNEWTWVGGNSTATYDSGQPGVYGVQGTPAPANVPGSRSRAVSWTDVTGNFWLFGGYGLDVNGNQGLLNDLWQYSPTTNEWTWMSGSNVLLTGYPNVQPGVYGIRGTPAPTNVPGGRDKSISWTDKSGNLWLFGGEGVNPNGTSGVLNDLWEYSPTTNEWTWMSGSSTLPSNGIVPGVYGVPEMPTLTNMPGARSDSVGWIDKSGNLWLLGGHGFDSVGNFNILNDLWQYSPTTNEWTWMGGSSTVPSGLYPNGQPGIYGVQGTPAPTNVPGGREDSVSWTDVTGNFWLFGGWGLDINGTLCFLNDLWMYQLPIATATSLTSSLSPSIISQTVTITATVVPINATATPVGTVQFYINGVASGSQVPLSSGVASFAPVPLAAGVSSITATYIPSANYAFTASTSATFAQVVNPLISTATTLASSANPSISGQLVTFTATVMPISGTSTPTGTVQFSVNGTAVGTPVTLTGGTATFASTTLVNGTDSASAVYTPDSVDFITSTSNTLSQVVVSSFNLGTTGSVNLTTATTSPGGTATFTFTVSPAAPLTTFPAAITFTADGCPTGATCTFAPPSVAQGAVTTTVTLTVALSGTTASLQPNSNDLPHSTGRSKSELALLALFLLPLADKFRKAGKQLGKMVAVLLLLVAGITVVGSLSGCSSLSNPTTYTINVVATSGGNSQSTPVTLIVR